MFDLIRTYQLDIMLVLCAACLTMLLMLAFTRFLPARRKWIMILLEVVVTLLLASDRQAYLYSGRQDSIAVIMVRVSNFLVFILTSALVLSFNLLLIDWFYTGGKGKQKIPHRLVFVNYGTVIGMLLIIISQFTGWIYYIDDQNIYHRGEYFLAAYIVPMVCPIIQYTVILSYRRVFTRKVFLAMNLFIFVPIVMALVQIRTYGLSLVNMSMVLVSVGLYIFTYLDINDEVERVHRLERDNLLEAKKSMERLFDQTADMLLSAVDKRHAYAKDHAKRVADLSERVAQMAGHDEAWCRNIRYAAQLHEVGLTAITGETSDEEVLLNRKAGEGGELLAHLTEYPWLSETIRCLSEHYDGSGSPAGLKGKEIPEMAAVIAIADGMDTLMNNTDGSMHMTFTVAREELLKRSGTVYDPEYVEMAVMILDADSEASMLNEDSEVEKEIECTAYRERITKGIEISENVTKVTFSCRATGEKGSFSAPSIVLFDAFDRRVHDNERSIKEQSYIEYGELWFDGHFVCTGARHIRCDYSGEAAADDGTYQFAVERYDDHVRIRLKHAGVGAEVLVALPDSTRSCYAALTGENCRISGIEIEKTGEHTAKGDIPRLADKVSFIQRLESDIPNVQVDRFRSAYSEGVAVKDGLTLCFHSMSLPTAHLVWHCPHLIMYTSADGTVGGEGYRPLAVLKLDGENDCPEEITNSFVMKKGPDFPGWEGWKEKNKEGLEYELRFVRSGKRISFSTQNLGISIANTTTVPDDAGEVYVTLTGDQCAFTDIRIKRSPHRI